MLHPSQKPLIEKEGLGYWCAISGTVESVRQNCSRGFSNNEKFSYQPGVVIMAEY
jgi:hypothetical protein